ncbi:MAG: hypothetical protein ABIM29_03755 [candidate division WOR-3 bacterium]
MKNENSKRGDRWSDIYYPIWEYPNQTPSWYYEGGNSSTVTFKVYIGKY